MEGEEIVEISVLILVLMEDTLRAAYFNTKG